MAVCRPHKGMKMATGSLTVIPANAGIQGGTEKMDSRFRGNDE